MRDSPLAAKLTGGVLAGGMARRMQGLDKGLQPFRGRPMAEYVMQAMRAVTSRQLISANRNLSDYARLGSPVITDHHFADSGPMGGIYHLLEACETPYLLTAPCDAPFISAKGLARLLQPEPTTSTSILRCLHDGRRIQPLFMLISQDHLPAIENYLEKGGRRVQEWFAMQEGEVMNASEWSGMFQNFNTLSDLQAIKNP